jgi:hypothetical protein
MVSCFEWELEIHEAVVALPLLGQLVVRGWWWSRACWGSYPSRYEVVSRSAYGRHVCILRMLWVLSPFPRSKRETRLLVDCAAPPPHVFVLVCPLVGFFCTSSLLFPPFVCFLSISTPLLKQLL